VISSAVSCFNPVLIEVAIGLGTLRSVARFRTLAAAVSETIGIGTPIVLLPLGSLAQRPQIDDVSHGASSKTGHMGVRTRRIQFIAANYAATGAGIIRLA
jgi:hypothetical protein